MKITDDVKEVLDELVGRINALLEKKEYVVIGFPGGRSVKAFNEELRKEKRIDWRKVHIFMVDERLVRIIHEESNFRLIDESLLKWIKIPQENIHPFKIQSEPDYGIKRYVSEFKRYGGNFDIAIFGVGEDGHIGALYPKLSIKNDAEDFFILHDSPKPPRDRMTLSRKLASKIGMGIFLFVGEAKKDAFNKFRQAGMKTEDLPAKIAYDLKDAIVYENLGWKS